MTTAPAPAPPPPLRLALVELCEEYEAMHAKNDDVRFGADAVLRAVRDVLDSHPEQPPPSRDRYEQLRARVEMHLYLCGHCDGGLPMDCTCPSGDYRPVLNDLWDAYTGVVAPPAPAGNVR